MRKEGTTLPQEDTATFLEGEYDADGFLHRAPRMLRAPQLVRSVVT